MEEGEKKMRKLRRREMMLVRDCRSDDNEKEEDYRGEKKDKEVKDEGDDTREMLQERDDNEKEEKIEVRERDEEVER